MRDASGIFTVWWGADNKSSRGFPALVEKTFVKLEPTRGEFFSRYTWRELLTGSKWLTVVRIGRYRCLIDRKLARTRIPVLHCCEKLFWQNKKVGHVLWAQEHNFCFLAWEIHHQWHVLLCILVSGKVFSVQFPR